MVIYSTDRHIFRLGDQELCSLPLERSKTNASRPVPQSRVGVRLGIVGNLLSEGDAHSIRRSFSTRGWPDFRAIRPAGTIEPMANATVRGICVDLKWLEMSS